MSAPVFRRSAGTWNEVEPIEPPPAKPVAMNEHEVVEARANIAAGIAGIAAAMGVDGVPPEALGALRDAYQVLALELVRLGVEVVRVSSVEVAAGRLKGCMRAASARCTCAECVTRRERAS